MAVRLAVALAVLAPLQVIGLVRISGGPHAHGPASELVGAAPAPGIPIASLLLEGPPAGFASVASRALTLSDLAGASANSQAASAALSSLGFRRGYAGTWTNPPAHQFVIVAVTEFNSAGGAAARKSGVEQLWSKAGRSRVPVSGITGLVASVYQPAPSPGKLPQVGYSVEFRVERWEFNVIVGTNMGAPGSTPVTPALLQDVVSRQIAGLRPRLARYFPPDLTGDQLVLRDRVCRCSIAAPNTWEPIAIDASLAASIIDKRGLDPTVTLSASDLATQLRKNAAPVIFSLADTATDGTTLFSLFRTPRRSGGAHALIAATAKHLGSPASAFVTLHLSAGKAFQFTHRPYTAGFGANAVETTTTFDHAGWTYIAVGLTTHSNTGLKPLESVLRSVRIVD